ncbi:MAG: aminotransferase class I/II-fold pyridoxal phosphate-dependent enzyme [Gemmataceae bacterium]
MSLSDRWANNLEGLRERGRYRTLVVSSGIDFTSNDYLGYAGGRAFLFEKVTPASDVSFSGTASRLLRGHHPIWEKVEAELARWHGAETALVMTSGYAANEGLLSTIVEPQDWVASDEYNHASIIDGLRLAKAQKYIFRHNDLDHLEDGLREAIRSGSSTRERFIVTESLFSMEGDSAPLREISELAERYDANLVVDEAHATGCFGQNGSGLVDALGLRSKVLATVHTGGKALAVSGAYVCGSSQLKALLVNKCRHFIFTTALPPQVGVRWLETLPIVESDEEGRERLHSNARTVRKLVDAFGLETIGDHYVVPIVVGEDRRAVGLSSRFQQLGVDLRAIRPPTVPQGTARLRISVHADHSLDDLERLVMPEIQRTIS